MSGPTPAGGVDYSQYQTDASAKESYRLKDGVGGKDIFNGDAVKDIPKHTPTVGKKLMDIIMYPAGANHPMVVAGRIPIGTMVHITWAFIHKKIGPGQDWLICLAKTYGQRCPICEYANAIRSSSGMTDEEIKLATAPYYSGKHPLGIYNSVHHTNPNQITWQEPIEYWPINNSFMESKLQAQAKQALITQDAPTGYINYQWPMAGPQGGRHIEYEVIQKGAFFDYIGHKFYQRQTPVPPHVLQGVHCLDDFFIVPTFEDVKLALEADIEMKEEMRVGGGQPTGEGIYGGPMGSIGGVVETGPGGVYSPPIFGTPDPQCKFSEHGATFGISFNSYQECQTCQIKIECQDKHAILNPPVSQPAAIAPQPAAPIAAAPITAAPTMAPPVAVSTPPAPVAAAPIMAPAPPSPSPAPVAAPVAAGSAPIPRRPGK